MKLFITHLLLFVTLSSFGQLKPKQLKAGIEAYTFTGAIITVAGVNNNNDKQLLTGLSIILSGAVAYNFCFGECKSYRFTLRPSNVKCTVYFDTKMRLKRKRTWKRKY